MNDLQLELGFGTVRPRRSNDFHARRSGRAHWWFDRMRQVVERAIDFQPAPLARPEQTYFAEPIRRVALSTSATRYPRTRDLNSDEHQICE